MISPLLLVLALVAPAASGAVERHTLPCGAELFLVDDPGASRVRGSILIDAGSEIEPADRVGLVRVLADALDRGGGGGRSREELDAWFGARRGGLNVSHDRRAIALDFFCAPEALSGCLELLRDLLAAPGFDEEQIGSARQRLLAAMGDGTADPAVVANRGVYEVVYGEDVPGRRVPHVADVEAISRNEVLAFHRAHVGPNRLRIALHGPLSDELPAAAAALFGALERAGPAPPVEWPAFRRPNGLRVVVIDVPGAARSSLRVGFPGVPLDHADAPALHLWSSYHEASGDVRVQFAFERAVTAGREIETREAAGELAALVRLCSPAANETFERERLERVRGTLVGLLRPVDGYIRARGAALRHLAGRAEAAGEAHAARLEALPAAELLAAVRRHAPGSGLVAVLAGPADALVPQLEAFGEIEVRRALRQPRGSAAGLALRARLFAAVGGSERWAALDTLVYEGATTVRGLDEPVVVRVEHDLASGNRRIEQRLPGAAPTFVVSTPAASWSTTGDAHVPAAAPQHALLRAQEERQLVQLLRTLALGRGVHVDAGEGRQLVLRRGAEVLAWLDLGEDGRPLRRGYEDADGAAQLTEIRGWVEADGLRFPERLLRPGVENLWVDFAPHAALDPALFVRPVR